MRSAWYICAGEISSRDPGEGSQDRKKEDCIAGSLENCKKGSHKLFYWSIITAGNTSSIIHGISEKKVQLNFNNSDHGKLDHGNF